VNIEGSHDCLDCDISCSGCTGSGSDHCVACSDRYFLDNGVCRSCHPSCFSACTDDSSLSCDSCKDGWVHDEGQGCLDVNECTQTDANCEDNTYCLNTEGSFVCKGCHQTCDGCHGPGAADCTACSPGYTSDHTEESIGCVDINECLTSDTSCPGVGEKCVNTIGSFKCDCKTDYIFVRGKCQLKNKGNKKKKKEKENVLEQKPSHSKEPNRQIFNEKLDEGMEGFEESLKHLGEPLQGIPIEDSIVMEGSMNPDGVNEHSLSDGELQETLADQSGEEFGRAREDL